VRWRRGSVFLVLVLVLVLAIVAVVTAAAAMYEARQETKRTEIECYSANTIAAAAARYIDSTHEVS